MTRKTSFHWAWIILATCFVNLFINYSVRLGYGVVLPEMIKDLSLSRTAGGTIFNTYLFSYILVTPITGYLTDRFGARYVITTCTLILGTGAILVHWVSGVLRDSTGSYNYSFVINTVMAALAVLLICTVKKKTMSTRYLEESQKR